MIARNIVQGHIRRGGTSVRPYYRTAPDRSVLNNFSFPGNYNPNTMRFTPGDRSVAYAKLVAKLAKTICPRPVSPLAEAIAKRELIAPRPVNPLVEAIVRREMSNRPSFMTLPCLS